jgi:hypothetical protein
MKISIRAVARSLAAGLLLAGLSTAQAAPIPDTPDAILTAAKQGPYGKIGPFLGNLYDEYRDATGKGVNAKSFKSSDPYMHVADGTVAIDLYASNAAALTNSLRSLGATRVDSRGPLISARVRGALGSIAGLPACVCEANPGRDASLPAIAVSQGDVTLRAPEARATFSSPAQASRSECYPTASRAIRRRSIWRAHLDVPAGPRQGTAGDREYLKNGACPGADEGRAIGQIVMTSRPVAYPVPHAFESEFDFAEGISLADAGAKVIVDDVIYFAEPMFSDGMVAQATDIVTARGVSYFTSAGNYARASSRAFRPVNVVTNAGKNLNSKGPRWCGASTTSTGSRRADPATDRDAARRGCRTHLRQQDQPPDRDDVRPQGWTGSRARRRRQATSTRVLRRQGSRHPGVSAGRREGITCQLTGDRNIGGDAVDVARSITRAAESRAVVLCRLRGVWRPGSGFVKYSVFLEDGAFRILAFDTKSGTAWGHEPGQGAGRRAASWYATVPFSTSGVVPPNDTKTSKIDLSPCDPGCLNDFSSAGNVPIYLDKFGTRLATPERRFQPSVTGPDGGNSSFFISDSSYDDDDGNGINSVQHVHQWPDLPGNEFRTSVPRPRRRTWRPSPADAAEQSGADAGAGPHDPRADGAADLEAVHVGPAADRQSDHARTGRLQRRRGHGARGRRCGRGQHRRPDVCGARVGAAWPPPVLQRRDRAFSPTHHSTCVRLTPRARARVQLWQQRLQPHVDSGGLTITSPEPCMPTRASSGRTLRLASSTLRIPERSRSRRNRSGRRAA